MANASLREELVSLVELARGADPGCACVRHWATAALTGLALRDFEIVADAVNEIRPAIATLRADDGAPLRDEGAAILQRIERQLPTGGASP